MKRITPVVVVLAVLLAGAVVWKCRGGGDDSTAPQAGGSERGSATSGSSSIATRAAPRVDPRTVARASIAGTVTDETKAPAVHVLVCADFSSPVLPGSAQKDPVCAGTD